MSWEDKFYQKWERKRKTRTLKGRKLTWGWKPTLRMGGRPRAGVQGINVGGRCREGPQEKHSWAWHMQVSSICLSLNFVLKDLKLLLQIVVELLPLKTVDLKNNLKLPHTKTKWSTEHCPLLLKVLRCIANVVLSLNDPGETQFSDRPTATN